jgi:hypothetical protein
MAVKYSYQIKSVLYRSGVGITGFRVLLATEHHFFEVDVPAENFDNETLQYMRFRLAVSQHMDVRNLPRRVQHKIRTPLGRFLDFWILEDRYGNSGKRKDPDA